MITNASYLNRKPPEGWRWALVNWEGQGGSPVLIRGKHAYAILTDLNWELAQHLPEGAWLMSKFPGRIVSPLTRLTKILYAVSY